MIEIQGDHCRAANSREPFEMVAAEPKMIRLSLFDRMKKWDLVATHWITSRGSIGFVQIATWQAKAKFNGSEAPPFDRGITCST